MKTRGAEMNYEKNEINIIETIEIMDAAAVNTRGSNCSIQFLASSQNSRSLSSIWTGI